MGTHNLRDVSPLLSYRTPAPQAPEAKGFYLEAVRKNGTIARRADASGWDTARVREEVFSMLLTLDNIDHVHETREGCISNRDWSTRLSSTKKEESRPNKDDFGYRAARAVFALAVVGLLAIFVLGALDYRGGRRCERSGRCDTGTATWVNSKCVCVVYAK